MDLKQFIKESGNEYASIVEEGLAAGDVNTYIDTGSYLFNALLSGSCLVDYLQQNTQHLLEKVQQVKRTLL